MCGITGFITQDKTVGRNDLVSMTATLHHRGPDDSGHELFTCADTQIGLGHSRLAIIDLTKTGHQPMLSRSGRFSIVYNGEIYNHKELRQDLQKAGQQFLGTSDTEVLLVAIEKWGLQEAVTRCNGMFAFAVWDKKEHCLSLCRDRIGIKPLYYGWTDNDFVFGSELKALKGFRNFKSNIDRNSLALYFRYNYIPAPYSIFQNTYKLEPGCILHIELNDYLKKKSTTKVRYWDLHSVWSQKLNMARDPRTIEDELESLLKDAVAKRMISDVPLGAFLSGGVDSSLIVAMMQEQSTTPIKTFTIGFHENKYNEADHARKIANHLNTDHTEIYVTSKDLLDVAHEIPVYWDEPFSDYSQIPTLIVSRLARQHVAVSLSGDGGDELFAGYKKYFQCLKWWRLQKVPAVYRNATSSFCHKVLSSLEESFGILSARKLMWRTDLLKSENIYDYYQYLKSSQRSPERLVLGCTLPNLGIPSHDMTTSNTDPIRQMQEWDLLSYLPDDILTKVDRASMAVSLEARVPLLDHRIVELAAHMPSEVYAKNHEGKLILKTILSKYIPTNLFDRPKTGFGIPIKTWLRKDLRDWVESLLDESTIQQQGLLDPKTVRTMWNECLHGKSHWSRYIWDVLVFQAWLKEQTGRK